MDSQDEHKNMRTQPNYSLCNIEKHSSIFSLFPKMYTKDLFLLMTFISYQTPTTSVFYVVPVIVASIGFLNNLQGC